MRNRMTNLALLIAATTAILAGRIGAAGDTPPPATDDRRGLTLRLSDADASQAKGTGGAAAPSIEPLDDATAARLLETLPPVEVSIEKPAPPLRPSSLPPPRAGRTVAVPFPPSTAVPPPPKRRGAGPLRVLRRMPEGEAAVTSHVSVTFSQPMVALAALGDAQGGSVPARLSPDTPGRWRWIGSDTLVFEPKAGFPPGVTYSVEIPAGMRSTVGGVLPLPVRWAFRPPTPKVARVLPKKRALPREPVFAVVVDQAMSSEELLKHIDLRAGSLSLPIRLATKEERRASEDGEIKSLHWQEEDGHWLAFRCDRPLPLDSSVTVSVRLADARVGKPASGRVWRYRTAGPFVVKERPCRSKWQSECSPSSDWSIDLSNAVGRATVTAEAVSVTPEVADLRVSVRTDDSLKISGSFSARTTYTLTLTESLRDIHGQAVAGPRTMTVRVGDEPPALLAPQSVTVLDPSLGGALLLYVVNREAVEVELRAVGPDDYDAYQTIRQAVSAGKPHPPLPGRRVQHVTLPVTSKRNEWMELSVPLTPALKDGLGHVLVTLRGVPPLPTSCGCKPSKAARPTPPPFERLLWVQVTGLSLEAFVDDEGVTTSVSALADGQPLAGVEVSLAPDGERGLTDGDGLARLAFADRARPLLIARRGLDVALLPEHAGVFQDPNSLTESQNPRWWEGYDWEDEDEATGPTRSRIRVYGPAEAWQERASAPLWKRHPRPDRLAWHVFDPRELYRPGEDVKLKGWLRRVVAGPRGDVEPLATSANVSFVANDARGNEIARGESAVNRFGGFDVSFRLPREANLGWVRLILRCDIPGTRGGRHVTGVHVVEFRRPEFEIMTSVEPGPYVIGGRAIVHAAAAYFAGGALPDAAISWHVSSSAASWSPEGREGYVFGRRRVWGWYDGARGVSVSHEGRTDAMGRHALAIDFARVEPPDITQVIASPSVADVNRQTHAGQAVSLVVHPASLAVGLRARQREMVAGQPLEIEALVTALDGRAVAGRDVTLRAESIQWKDLPGEDWDWDHRREPTVIATQDCSVTSQAEAVVCRFAPAADHDLRITASATDLEGRPAETVLWAEEGLVQDDAGGMLYRSAREYGHRHADAAALEAKVTTDRQEYRAGDVARLTVESPFAPAEGVLTLQRSGVVRSERFHMYGKSTVLSIPVEDTWTPNVDAHVALAGAGSARLLRSDTTEGVRVRPALAEGTVRLKILPNARALAVKVWPREERVRPGQSAAIEVEVRAADTHPIADAEVAVAVIDEAILALASYTLADPLRSFEMQRRPGVQTRRLLDQLALRAQGPLTWATLSGQGYHAGEGAVYGVLGGVMGGVARSAAARAREDFRLRADFNPLALFAASMVTDAAGRASVTFTLPDNLTRYRILAVATDGGRRFGRAESALTADLPLMARPSLPRFLNRGDVFELPVVVQNHTAHAEQVDVAVRASGIDLTGGSGRRVLVPAGDRAEVRFPAHATRLGQARVQVAAASQTASDAAALDLPIYLPVTTETVAAHGQLDDDQPVSLKIEPPLHAVPEYGGLSVTMSSTALAEMEDALLYLATYRYECVEQVASRLLAIVTLKDMLAAFDGSGRVDSKDLLARADRDLERLLALQNDDGGFALWEHGKPSMPISSLHAAHALARARVKGMAVPAPALERAASYLRAIEKRMPQDYDDDARQTLAAYALYVRHLLGRDDPRRARSLSTKVGPGGLPVETLGWLLAVLARDPASTAEAAALRSAIANRVTETSETAHFAVSYRDDDHVVLRSARRADAVLLEALIEDQPRSTLIPKLVRGLLAQRRHGRWDNTQENCFVLLALSRYFDTFEKAPPDIVARAWLGERGIAETAFAGRSAARQQVTVPLGELGQGGAGTEVIVARQGRGRLHYRVGLDYAPAEARLAPVDQGFAVERVYEAVDRPEDVRRDADGAWRIRPGARVRVRVKMIAPARRYHVALVDPLPAGLEPGHSQWSFPAACWAEHENRRDDRLEAFASLLWGGEYEYAYLAQATTPGEFLAPPPRAEEMYSPEVFGRGATDRVIVEAPTR